MVVQPSYHYIRRKKRHCQPYPGGTQVQQLVVVPVPREPNTPTLAVMVIPRTRRIFGWFLLPRRCDATWHSDFRQILGVPGSRKCLKLIPQAYRDRVENSASHSNFTRVRSAQSVMVRFRVWLPNVERVHRTSDRALYGWRFMLCRAIPRGWRNRGHTVHSSFDP
jgi:hypothetical protein